jgi:hypothetical protein
VRVSILQPTYWARAHVWNRVLNSDVFVWLDSVKFSRSNTKWEDRTVVEAPDGRPIVLRLPLRGSRNTSWADAGLNEGWQRHERTIRQCYSKYPGWHHLEPLLGPVYGAPAATIDEVCWRTFDAVRCALGVTTEVVRSSDLGVSSSKGELVLDLVAAVHGTCYVSGAPGAAYLPLDRFAEAGIAIEVQDWSAPLTRNGLRNPSIIHLLASMSPAEASALLGTALATAQPAGP